MTKYECALAGTQGAVKYMVLLYLLMVAVSLEMAIRRDLELAYTRARRVSTKRSARHPPTLLIRATSVFVFY